MRKRVTDVVIGAHIDNGGLYGLDFRQVAATVGTSPRNARQHLRSLETAGVLCRHHDCERWWRPTARTLTLRKLSGAVLDTLRGVAHGLTVEQIMVRASLSREAVTVALEALAVEHRVVEGPTGWGL